jgi:hypothetical protein
MLLSLLPLINVKNIWPPDKPSMIITDGSIQFIDYVPVSKFEIKWFGGISFILTKLKITNTFNQDIVTFITLNILPFVAYYSLSCLLIFIVNKKFNQGQSL